VDGSANRRVTYQLVAEPDAVAALSAQVALETGLPAAHIEKDFWITEVLRGVVAAAAAANVEVLFKGGTSLSKAFGLIRRFSEDVDVLVIFPPGGQGARDTLLKRLVRGATEATLLAPVTVPEATGKGEKRGTRFYYGTENAMELG
jgi:predicted nucleotidyltransferase component of viral defense system